jgi:hypothetical protein
MPKYRIYKERKLYGTFFYSIQKRVFPLVWKFCWRYGSNSDQVIKKGEVRRFTILRQTAEKQIEQFKNNNNSNGKS